MRDFSSTTGRAIPILNSLPEEVIPNPLMQYLTPFGLKLPAVLKNAAHQMSKSTIK